MHVENSLDRGYGNVLLEMTLEINGPLMLKKHCSTPNLSLSESWLHWVAAYGVQKSVPLTASIPLDVRHGYQKICFARNCARGEQRLNSVTNSFHCTCYQAKVYIAG